MGTTRNVIGAAACMVITGVGTWNSLDVLLQQGTPSQPGQPSQQPGPKNPQPRPSNPQPRPGNQDPTPDPNNPGAPNRQPGEQDRDQRDAQPGAADRYLRPFAFQSPGLEGRFNQSTRRLMQMEQRMQQSHERLLQRLGEARQLTGARQTEALFEVLQQMLQDQADLQRYLVQARTAWTGDMDISAEDASPDGVTQFPPERNDR